MMPASLDPDPQITSMMDAEGNERGSGQITLQKIVH